MTAVNARYRSVFYDLRTEGGGSGREAAAIGLGIFIGCLPLYGFHLAICWVAGWLLKLNRLKLYLAAHVSNPLFAPTLVFAEIQTGAWLRRGDMHDLTIETVRTTSLWVFGADALVGSLLIGGALGAAMATATYAMSRASADDEAFLDLVRESSDRYITTSITAWEFARGKLRGDPIYRAIVTSGLLPSGGALVDVGCGQGLTLALVAEAERRFRQRAWPVGWSPPPQFSHRIGVELRSRTARIAKQALGPDAEIVQADIRQLSHTRCRAALFLDVLQMMPAAEQEAVIAATAAVLEPGGVILVREADASAGWRFTAVRLGNRLKAIAFGSWRQTFHFRTSDEWVACFARHGLTAEVQPMTSGTFANVMLRVTRSL